MFHVIKIKMSIASKTKNMNTQTKYTNEEVDKILLTMSAISERQDTMSARIDVMEAQLSRPKRLSKPKRSDEEIAADKQRKADAKAEKKRLANEAKAIAKAEKKKLADEAKAAKVEEKRLANEAKATAKAEKKKAATQAKAAKGPIFDKNTYRRKRMLKYRNLNATDPENAYKGLNGKYLRIVQKKDDLSIVLRDQSHNWTEEATAHFNAMTVKWFEHKKTLPFSPDYVQPVKKKPGKKKANKKKSLQEKVVVEDTDEELCEEIPEGYNLYHRFREGPNSVHTLWKVASPHNEKKAIKQGCIPLDEWAFMEDCGGSPFNDKVYTKNPFEEESEEDDSGKNILNTEGEVVGNGASSFNPLGEDKKPAATVEVDVEDEDSDDDLVPDVYDEFDDDGYKSFYNAQFNGEHLKITRDGRVFRSEDGKFLGKYNEDTGAIDNDSSSEEDSDAFEGENDAVDVDVF